MEEILKDLFHLPDLVLQAGGLVGPLEDILPVEVTELYFRHILRLDLVDAETDHQVRHHLSLFLRLPDDADSLVDIQQDALQPLQKVELLPAFGQVKVHPAADALRAEGAPLLDQLVYSHHPGSALDEDVEVAGEGVLQGGHAEQLSHELIRVGPPL